MSTDLIPDVIIYPVATVVFGALVPLIILIRVSGIRVINIVIGAGLLVLTLIIQPPIQMLALFPYGGEVPEGAEYFVVLVYAAGVSGFLQEGLKLLAVRRESPNTAIWVGYGFGTAEVALVAVTQLMTIPLFGSWGSLGAIVPAYERFITTIYHSFSTWVLAHYSRLGTPLKGYILMAVVHSTMNGAAGLYTNFIGLQAPSPFMIILYVVLTVAALIPVCLYSRWRSDG